jgi:tetratricopeptide (TPR) repeat protein
VLSILSALEVQIEDGGDSTEVNDLLLAALRMAILHQVGQEQAKPALSAIDVFAAQERLRWQQVRDQTLPPIEAPSEERMEALALEGYRLLEAQRTAEACDRWLTAWEIAKSLISPSMRSTEDFEAVYPGEEFYLRDWCFELMYELENAGVGDDGYARKRLVFVQEFLERFPDEDPHTQCEFLRGQGEALWRLGRQAEAEALYAAAIERLPDEAWLYIGWADHYWLWHDAPKDFARGEEILRRALARDTIDDRQGVLERLHDLYQEWPKPREAAIAAQELAALTQPSPRPTPKPAPLVAVASAKAPPAQAQARPKRNDPCWCGSGKKYKHCHMKTDR